MTLQRFVSLATLVVLLTGCGAESHPTPKVSVQTIDATGLKQAIAKHRGHVVLVDYWATWCKPCVELLPHTAELQQRWANRGLTVITVSMDDPKQRSAVESLLSRQSVAAENYLSNYGVGPDAFTAFGIEDGAVPHMQLFDRRGSLHKTFASGGLSLNPIEIDRAITHLLDDAKQNSPRPLGDD
jgi:thiol-disulfide isomerase/thioredoxin